VIWQGFIFTAIFLTLWGIGFIFNSATAGFSLGIIIALLATVFRTQAAASVGLQNALRRGIGIIAAIAIACLIVGFWSRDLKDAANGYVNALDHQWSTGIRGETSRIASGEPKPAPAVTQPAQQPAPTVTYVQPEPAPQPAVVVQQPCPQPAPQIIVERTITESAPIIYREPSRRAVYAQRPVYDDRYDRRQQRRERQRDRFYPYDRY